LSSSLGPFLILIHPSAWMGCSASFAPRGVMRKFFAALPHNGCRDARQTEALWSGVVTTSANEPNREAGGTSARTTVWLAWVVCAVTLLVSALVLLVILLG
jgi:hypothetical protein